MIITVEQDIIDRASDLGYMVSGNYPAEPYYLRGRCKAGFVLQDRADALTWLDNEAKQQIRATRLFLQQNAEDDMREY